MQLSGLMSAFSQVFGPPRSGNIDPPLLFVKSTPLKKSTPYGISVGNGVLFRVQNLGSNLSLL
jgi:hypothetical protein